MTRDTAFAEFLRAHPEYGRTAVLDRLQASDYSRVDHRSKSISRTRAAVSTLGHRSDTTSRGRLRFSRHGRARRHHADGFVEFARSLRDQTRLAISEVTFDIDSCRILRDGS